MSWFRRAFSAVAAIGIGYAAYRSVPVVWDGVGPLNAVIVATSMGLAIISQVYTAIVGGSIFERTS